MLVRVLGMFGGGFGGVGCVGFLLRVLVRVLVDLMHCVFCFLVYCVIWYSSVCGCGLVGGLTLVLGGCGGFLPGCVAGWRWLVFFGCGYYVSLWAVVI